MNNIFQATKSKTKFGFDRSEAENAGLESYLQEERQLIKQHLMSGSGGLVMGGFSGIGKTELTMQIMKLIDGSMLGQLFDLEHPQTQAYYENRHGNNRIVIDEGMSLTELSQAGSVRLKSFLDTKTARVVLGGGVAFSGVEQTTTITNALTAIGVNVQSTHTFPVLRMSNLQIAQMIIGNSMSASQAYENGSLDIQSIADTCMKIVDPLRIPGHINTCIDLYGGKISYNPTNYVIGPKSLGTVPGAKKYHEQMLKLFGGE